MPVIEGRAVGDLITRWPALGKGAKCVGEIRLPFMHQQQQVVDQCVIPLLYGGKPKLCAMHLLPGGVVDFWKAVHSLRGLGDGRVLIRIDEGQQGGCQLCHVPHGHLRLPRIGIAAHTVDR